jgi:SLT domain-containing protein
MGGGFVSEDPMAQIYAAIHYAAARYGGAGMASVIGHGHGYDQGGWLQPGATMVLNKTGRPEPVLTGEQWDKLTAAVRQPGTTQLAGTLNVTLPEGGTLTAALHELDYKLRAARLQGFLGG